MKTKMKRQTSNIVRLLPRLGAALGLFFMSSPVMAAHEQAIAITELTLMAEQQGQPSCVAGLCRVEVAHRFSIHDAESTLLSVLGERPDLGFNPEAQAKFEAYVQGKFSVSEVTMGLPVPLSQV